MSLLTPILKPALVKRRAELEVASGTATATNRAVATLVTNQLSKAVVRGFTIIQDEPETIAGTGLGPTPTDFLMASVAFCENVVFARQAALSDIDLEALETTAAGTWDMKGLFELGGADSAFREITVETRVRTTSAVDKVIEAARATHRRCPVHATLAKASRLVFHLYVNDVEVAL